MHGLAGRLFLTILILSTTLTAGTPGSFRGTIVDGPHAAGRSWIYVQGRNAMARRVDVAHARVVYGESVPTATRLAKPEDALVTGAEVRVTAEQGSDGEWKAREVEILRVATSEEQRAGR